MFSSPTEDIFFVFVNKEVNNIRSNQKHSFDFASA